MTTKTTFLHPDDAAMLLKAKINESCLNTGVPDHIRQNLLTETIDHFTLMTNGTILYKGVPADLDSFVVSYVDGSSSEPAAEPTTREAILNKMEAHVKESNMKEYRACREQYSSLTE